MYRYSDQMRQDPAAMRKRMRILTILLVMALTACAVLGAEMLRKSAVVNTAQKQLQLRVRSCCADAKNLAERLPSTVQSNTASSLANIRQSIYAMEQLNNTAIALFGEAGRLVPSEAFTALYSDIDTYFSIIQVNTVSVMETRELLINHLAALQALLSQ
ncbi:MAG: hypothetical protein IJS53_05305 [Clostridia bacterium]|nr:hypothetical protein [Clostridia bacterium]